MSKQVWSALALGGLLCGQAQAQEASAVTPEPAPIEAAAEEEQSSGLEWRATVTVHGDGLLHSDLPEERQKSTELRRARLGIQVLLNDQTRLSVGGDFSDGARLRDLFIEFRSSPVYWVAGRFPEPFGLAAQQGSRAGLMMEAPMAAALGPGFGLGGAVNLGGDDWGFTGGLFTSSSVVSDEEVLTGAREEDAITLRYTRTQFRTEDRVLHLGLGFSDREPTSEAFRFVAIPESVLLRGLQVSSGFLPGDGISYSLLGAEVGFAQGPLLLQAEYVAAELPDFGLGSGKSVYRGYYAEAGWVLTGERRPYSTRRGAFGPVSPGSRWGEGAWGAWELAARYSVVDLTDNPFENLDEFVGEEDPEF